jgi:hypothetical protein
MAIGNDTFVVSASISPETITWAKQMVGRKSARLLELFAWARDAIASKVSLRGDWGKFGALGKLARDVVNQASNNAIFIPSNEVVSAAKIYRMAKDGDERAQAVIQSMGNAEPTLVAIYLAYEMLQREDWYERTRDLCSLANQGDAGSRMILEAVYAFKEPESDLDNEPEIVGITYDLTHAISSPRSSSRSMSQYINHYRHARLAPYKPDLDAFAGLLRQSTHAPDPFVVAAPYLMWE